MRKILPCPFCGNEAIIHDPDLDVAFCNACHAEGGLDGLKGWNQRDIVAALEAVLLHLRTEPMPQGVGELFQRRVARGRAPDPEDLDATFSRDLTEALVALLQVRKAIATQLGGRANKG